MWRRTYLFLILIRLYFSLSPSYLHPDENFQGPEVIAGRIFSYPAHLTWEFTSSQPIRSVFPLWLFYGTPMLILRSLWEGIGQSGLPPAVVYYTLRVLMFSLSFVLEDWALHELVHSPRRRRMAVILVASSYVTWTFQTRTFSNSIETILVLWSLVLIERIIGDKQRSGLFASGILSFLIILGIFNRITFPAFVFIPGLRLLPHFRRKPYSLIVMLVIGAVTTFMAVLIDTMFYANQNFTFRDLLQRPVITPLNNLLYNSSSANLAEHGLHPHYQHLVANLFQLLGPAYPLFFFFFHNSFRLASAVCGIFVLSLVPHQEPRFLLPAIPLILSSISLPRRYLRTWTTSWLIFNVLMGLLMGKYHQGGVVPAQMYLAGTRNVTQTVWWKTYSPPTWLLGGKIQDVMSKNLMGMPGDRMLEELRTAMPCPGNFSVSSESEHESGVYVIAPLSATYLDTYSRIQPNSDIYLTEVWRYRSHVNLDDLDFGDDGVWPTLKRVIGRRGIGIWQVRRQCE